MNTSSQPADLPKVLPFYVVCDASTSMRGEPIRAVNEELRQVHQVLSSDPLLNDLCRFAVITFASKVIEVVPLKRLASIELFPELVAQGQTRLGKCVDEISVIIRRDIDRLRAEGRTVLRPVLFFITDGRPTDAWKRRLNTFLDRTANPAAPNVIAFGVGNANEETISTIGRQRAMMARTTESVPAALRAVIRSLTQTIVGSLRDPQLRLQLPTETADLRIVQPHEDR
jgi:uncharacterized protein YegL